jgi:Bacterial RNA polymerase, alpha chain C terminal domain
MLADLGETTWQRYSQRTCEKLGEAVVKHVASRRVTLTSEIIERHLPTPKTNVGIEDLEIEVRTRNCLKRMIANWRIKSLSELGRLTIGQILPVHGFGVKCLVDLLSAIEAISPEEGAIGPYSKKVSDSKVGSTTHSSDKLHGRLTAEAKRIKRSRWAHRVRRDDPRLGPYLETIHIFLHPRTNQELRSETHFTALDLAVCILNRKDDPADPAMVATQLRRLRSSVQSVSMKTLEEELSDIIASLSRRHSAAIVARREGWDGRGGCTLQAAGDEFGLTRERVRQVCERFEDSLSGKIPFTPVLDRALALVSANLPSIADDIETTLQTKGFSQRPFRAEGLLRAVELKRQPAPFTLSRTGSKRIIFPTGKEPSLSLILRIARSTVSRWGIANVQDIAAKVAQHENSRENVSLVARILSAEPAFQRLDEAKGWFRLCDLPRNVLLSLMEKVFSVAPEIEVGELRNAVSRHHRMQGFAPPRMVMLELCRQASSLRVEGTRIIAKDPPKPEQSLTETEMMLFKVLTLNGPVMQRERLEDLCVANGMNRSTFYSKLDSSPIIARYATGVYGLVGANVTPGAIQSLITKHQPQKVVMDFGWGANQSLWIGYRLSKNMIKAGVCGLPSPIRRFVSGDFSIKDEDGSAIGGIRSRESQIDGLSSLFSRRGGEPGDYLVLVFDLRTREVAASIGDKGLLEEFQTAPRDKSLE